MQPSPVASRTVAGTGCIPAPAHPCVGLAFVQSWSLVALVVACVSTMARADLFSLPLVEALRCENSSTGARSRRRQSRRHCEAQLCNEAISALNWCAGEVEDGSSRATPAHSDTQEVVLEAVRSIGQDDEGLSARVAASALLKGRLDYSSEKSGDYQHGILRKGRLSDVVGSPNVKDVICSGARVFAGGYSPAHAAKQPQPCRCS